VLVIKEVQAAGFQLVDFSNLYFRPNDALALEVGDMLTILSQVVRQGGRKERPQFVYQGSLAAVLCLKLVGQVPYSRPAIPEWGVLDEDGRQEVARLTDPGLVGCAQDRRQVFIFVMCG